MTHTFICPHCGATVSWQNPCSCEGAHQENRESILLGIELEDRGEYRATRDGRPYPGREALRGWIRRDRQRQEMYRRGLRPPTGKR